MDTEKWKSVLVLKKFTRTSSEQARTRTISGQLKIVWQIYNKLKEARSQALTKKFGL